MAAEHHSQAAAPLNELNVPAMAPCPCSPIPSGYVTHCALNGWSVFWWERPRPTRPV